MTDFPISNDENVFRRRHSEFRWGKEIKKDGFGNGNGFQCDYQNGNASLQSYRPLIQYWK